MKSSPLRIDLSQPQNTPAGTLLGRMYYSGFIEAVLTQAEFSGYPHNGGMHSFSIAMQPADLKAFLDTVQDTFKGHPGVAEFVESSTAKMHQRYPCLTLH